jgi:integrase
MAAGGVGRPELAEREAVARSLRAAWERRWRAVSDARENSPMGRRAYGTGSLFVKGGKWYGRWWLGNQRVKRALGPVRQPGSREGLTRAQAEREMRRGMEAEAVLVRSHDRLTLIEAGERYVDHLEHVIERKRTTIQDYRGYLRGHFEPYFGDRAIDRVESGHVMGYIKRKRVEGLSAKTVQNHLTFLHGVFAFAKRRGWLSSSPLLGVDRPRRAASPNRRIRFLQPEELEATVRAVPDDELGGVERALYLTAAMTGLRQGELLALRWRDVDWVAGLVRVADTFRAGGSIGPTRPSPTRGDRCLWPIGWRAS